MPLEGAAEGGVKLFAEDRFAVVILRLSAGG